MEERRATNVNDKAGISGEHKEREHRSSNRKQVDLECLVELSKYCIGGGSGYWWYCSGTSVLFGQFRGDVVGTSVEL